MKSRPFHRFALLALIGILSGCAPYAVVRNARPRWHPAPQASGAVEEIQRSFAKAAGQAEYSPSAALGEYLKAAEAASRGLAENPRDPAFRDACNFATARVVSIVQKSRLDPWTRPLTVPAEGGSFLLTHRADPRRRWNPALYDFTPADELELKGSYITRRERTEGLGAPVVATERELNKDAAREFTMPRIYYGVTVLLRFEKRNVILSFEDPLATEQVRLNGHRFPLAADHTAPLAVMLAGAEPKKLELSRLLHPGKYAETARIARLQPYDPDKTVVLVVHGLMDSPATWTPMINGLLANPDIRGNYQFWFYSYPSGYPYPHSAAILRRELDAVQRRFPLRKKMVVIGHSMGGCISRLLITDTGDELWNALMSRPPGNPAMEPESGRILTDALIFRHRPEVGRVIFIAAPLRGADMAGGWMGRLGSRLVKTPDSLLRAGTDVLQWAVFRTGDLQLRGIPNSVDTLAPSNRFVKAVQNLPFTPGIPYHVISGDRGKGGNRDKAPPCCSDGLVPYWSSHLEGAASELVVPCNHSAHQNSGTIKEVERILTLHRAASEARR